jgi:hypothetical protein
MVLSELRHHSSSIMWILTRASSAHAFGSASTQTTSTLAHTIQAIGRQVTSFSSRQSLTLRMTRAFAPTVIKTCAPNPKP